MRILSLDPAFNNVGYVFLIDGALKSRGCIRASKRDDSAKLKTVDDYRRAAELSISLQLLITLNNPDLICFELASGAQDSRAARMLGMITGILSSAVGYGRGVEVFTPHQVKRTVKASDEGEKYIPPSKAEVIEWATKQCPKLLDGIVLKGDYEHIADAWAVYATYLRTVTQ